MVENDITSEEAALGITKDNSEGTGLTSPDQDFAFQLRSVKELDVVYL